jgi:MFS family permease
VVIFLVSQNTLAHDITGNNRAVGFVVFGQGLAMLLTTPLAGAIADRLPKQFLLAAIETVLAACAVSIVLLLATGTISIYLLAAVAFVFGGALCALGPAQFAYLGEVVPVERRANASALIQVCLNATRAFAPFLAGGFLAWSLVGARGAFTVVAALTVVALALALRMPAAERRQRQAKSVVEEIRLGFSYVAAEPRLRQLVANFIVVTLLGFSSFVVLPAYTQDVLGASEAGFGIMIGVSAIGALVASLLLASRAASRAAPAMMFAMSFAIGLSLVLTGLMPSFLLASVAMLLFGAVSGGFHTLNGALTLRVAAPEYVGRVIALNTLAWSATNLLGLPVGLLADLTSERAVMVAIGLTVSTAVVLLALWRRVGEAVAIVSVEVPTPP